MEMQQEHPKPGPQTASGVRPPTSSTNPMPQTQPRGDRRQLCTLGLGFLSCDVPLGYQELEGQGLREGLWTNGSQEELCPRDAAVLGAS